MLQGYAVPDVRAAEDRVRAGLADGELMMRAARGLAEVVALRARQRGAGRIVVLAGPGDNGGDALHAAALLARELDGPADAAAGRAADVTVVGVASRLHDGGSRAVREAGVPVHRVDPD